MKNIEKKLRCGVTLEDFLKQYDCNSEEELFKLLRKNFSRKTVNSYILRMEKNSQKRKDKKVILQKEFDKENDSINDNIHNIDLQTEIHTEETVKVEAEIKTGEQRPKEGVIDKFTKFFKKLIK